MPNPVRTSKSSGFRLLKPNACLFSGVFNVPVSPADSKADSDMSGWKLPCMPSATIKRSAASVLSAEKLPCINLFNTSAV